VPEVFVVTGASAGVGRATVERLARRGAAIALIARDPARLERTAAAVELLGGRALPLPLDVADAEAVDHAAAQVEERLGPIDVWINNAMATVLSPVRELHPDEVRRATEVTYLGTVWGTMAALRRMTPRNRGTIVQVGSALAYRSIPLQAAYCAAKHAVRGFTESLRSELLHDGSHVRLTMVQLPAHNTPQFDWCRNRLPRRAQPVPPIFQPEVAAQAIEHAALHPRRELYVGWPTVRAVAGEKLVPGLLDRILARNGWDAQQTPEPEHDRPDNLFAPVEGDYAAHGRFDGQARNRSWLLWASLRRAPLALGALALTGAGLAATERRR
jgi:NAD(P)-dependent dehydrogenase (short-subunit alcohol dehydrogenase family)